MRNLPALLGCLLAFAAAPATAAPLFLAGPGLVGIESGATGIYELGTVTLANATVGLRALLHNGQVLQVQSRHEGRWLARRSGSVGGKPITPTSFDALAAITGGMNVDVRQMQPQKQRQFASTAGLVVLQSPPGSSLAGQQAALAAPQQSRGAVAKCAATTCQITVSRGGAATGFTIALDDAASTWSFTGYGIVAIWPVPQAASLP
ncbi:MAG: hypothetical protein ACRC6L_04950 [Steroidobacteraceae bacterium]